MERHPELFEKAKQYEKPEQGFTWIQQESLVQLARAERVQEIKAKEEERRAKDSRRKKPRTLAEAFSGATDFDPDDEIGCLICHL